MDEPKWTAGEWTARESVARDGTWRIYVGDGDIFICKVLSDDKNPGRAEADARLIAAAPAMAEAIRATLDRLVYLRGLWGDEGVTRALCDKLRAALPADGA